MKRMLGFLLAALTCLLMAGCGEIHMEDTIQYDDPEKYTAGGGTVTEPVRNLEIQWVSGSVEICQGTENQVAFREKADGTLSDDLAMHWWLDGETLHIKFCASSWKLDSLEKQLTVTLPPDLVLESVQVTTASAEIQAPALQAKRVDCSTASGDVTARLLGAETIQTDTVSGAVEVTALDDAKGIGADTTSGDVRLTLGRVDRLDVNTVSGVTRITAAECRETDLDSTSGDVTLELQAATGACEIDTVSGDVTLSLPEDADAAVEFDTVSGSFDSELALRCFGGSGETSYQVSTTSGSLWIEAKESGSRGFGMTGQETEGEPSPSALASEIYGKEGREILFPA